MYTKTYKTIYIITNQSVCIKYIKCQQKIHGLFLVNVALVPLAPIHIKQGLHKYPMSLI